MEPAGYRHTGEIPRNGGTNQTIGQDPRLGGEYYSRIPDFVEVTEVEELESASSSARFHITFWLILFAAWFAATGGYHPTLLLRFLASLILVAGSACYVIGFLPQSRQPRDVLAAILWLVVFGAATAGLIHIAYDALLGPDPRRFGFMKNVAMDTAVVLANSLLCLGTRWLFRYARKANRPEQ